MKALVKSRPERGLWLENVPEPTISDHDVLIKVRKMAICGTDVSIYKWDDWSQKNVITPTVIGHEFVGEIAKMGAAVQGFYIGDRVAGEGHITCDHCRNCSEGKKHLCVNTRGVGYHRDGSFAEYLALPAQNLFRVPDSISDDLAAIFDPLGNAVHTALAFNMIGEDVLITGAGPIGIMSTAIARFVGARHIVVTDMNEERLALAKEMGASATVDLKKSSIPTAMRELGIKCGFDVAMEMSGNAQAMKDIIDNVYHGAGIAVLGLLPAEGCIDWHQVIFKMLTVKGIYGREIFATWYKMASMLESGLDISKVITHRFPFEEYDQAFKTILAGESCKVLLEWS